MYFFITDFGGVYPLLSVVYKEVFEEGHNGLVLQNLFHRNVVVLLLSLYFFQVLHSQTPLLSHLFGVLFHMVCKGLTKVFGNIFCIAFDKAMVVLFAFVEEAHLLIFLFFAVSWLFAWVRVPLLSRILTVNAFRDEGTRLSPCLTLSSLDSWKLVNIFYGILTLQV